MSRQQNADDLAAAFTRLGNEFENVHGLVDEAQKNLTPKERKEVKNWMKDKNLKSEVEEMIKNVDPNFKG